MIRGISASNGERYTRSSTTITRVTVAQGGVPQALGAGVGKVAADSGGAGDVHLRRIGAGGCQHGPHRVVGSVDGIPRLQAARYGVDNETQISVQRRSAATNRLPTGPSLYDVIPVIGNSGRSS